MKQKIKPEVGKQYTFEDKIIEVTSISDNGFYYKTVGGTGGRLRLAEYGSPLHESMRIYEKKETNLEHYAETILTYIDKTVCPNETTCQICDSCGDCPLSIIYSLFIFGRGLETDKFIKWCNEEYESPKPKLTLFEQSILECAVNRGYVWIARDEIGYLYIYSDKPQKNELEWGEVLWDSSINMHLFEDKFQFIKWTDEEPTYIPDLLKECEVVG